MLKNNKYIIILISSVIVTSIITFVFSTSIFLVWKNSNQDSIYFDTKSVKSETIQKYNRVKELLKSQYYQAVDEDKMLEGSISGMTSSLGDRYTEYYTKDQWKVLEESIEGSYVGIGVTIKLDKDGLVTISEMFNGSPSIDAGMKIGDKIVKVDGKDVRDFKADAVINMIRGEEDSTVKITVYRESEDRTLDLSVLRRKIKLENITSKVLKDGIGYIKISKFDAEIDNYFESQLDKLIEKGIKGLIIDVRDNPGGYFDQVVSIADRLLPKGVIVYTEDRYKKQVFQNSDERELGLPIVVLINGNSASASEILAGAIKDNKKGILVGTKSFGKGLVQKSLTFNDGSAIKFTIQRYFTPSGVCIQDKGIEPDDKVSLESKYENVPVSDIPQEDDLQLKKGIEDIEAEINE